MLGFDALCPILHMLAEDAEDRALNANAIRLNWNHDQGHNAIVMQSEQISLHK